MSNVYDRINEKLADWLLAQPLFFVGTAPLSAGGHVNVSPKGMAGTFAVLDPHRVGYLDYFGSGAETIAHVGENGRIVIMCGAFTGPPKVVRLHGTGRIVQRTEPEYPALREHFAKPRERGLRCVVVVNVERVSDSCGYSVPLMEYVADRGVLDRSHERRTPHTSSITRLPGTRRASTGWPHFRRPEPSRSASLVLRPIEERRNVPSTGDRDRTAGPATISPTPSRRALRSGRSSRSA